MYSREQRIKAVELYIEYGKRAPLVITELGYPNRREELHLPGGPRRPRSRLRTGDLPDTRAISAFGRGLGGARLGNHKKDSYKIAQLPS